jgi:predicted RNA-binding protein YlqC (UPF0109 family)
MKELVEFMAKALVDNPAQVEVTEIAGRDTSVIQLEAAKEDMGKIIGKKGRNVPGHANYLERCLQETRQACGS